MTDKPAQSFVMQYSGRQFGKSMESAKRLAEQARGFTDIKIVVVPHEHIQSLEAEVAALREAIGFLMRTYSPTFFSMQFEEWITKADRIAKERGGK